LISPALGILLSFQVIILIILYFNPGQFRMITMSKVPLQWLEKPGHLIVDFSTTMALPAWRNETTPLLHHHLEVSMVMGVPWSLAGWLISMGRSNTKMDDWGYRHDLGNPQA
jgi:hypothetical protein